MHAPPLTLALTVGTALSRYKLMWQKWGIYGRTAHYSLRSLDVLLLILMIVLVCARVALQ